MAPLGWAHTTGVSYSQIEVHEHQIDLRLRLNLRELQFVRDLDLNADLVLTREEVEAGFHPYLPRLLEHVTMRTGAETGKGRLRALTYWPERGELECWLEYSFHHPLEEVWMRMALHELTDSGHWNLAQIRYDRGEERRSFNLENPEARIVLFRKASSHLRLGWQFLALSLRQIATSSDWLLFVAGLVLIGDSRLRYLRPPGGLLAAELLAFAIGVWARPMLPPRFVGSALALSVVYIAAENLFLKEASYRSWIAVFFGTIYGLSFSNLLQEAGWPARGQVAALLGFQAGIILSVVGSVAVIYLVAKWFERWQWQRQGVVLLSLCLMTLGLFEFVQRTF